MEIAAERENNYPHGGGSGTGGKVRKQPPRKYHTKKPYDRAARVSNTKNGGWLSTLMDPVQRIITHIASTLRKPATPPAGSNLQTTSEEQRNLPETGEEVHPMISAPLGSSRHVHELVVASQSPAELAKAYMCCKRMGSVVESDMGSLVTVRRIRRQKPNVSGRSLRLPNVSAGFDPQHASSSCDIAPTLSNIRSTEDKADSSLKLVPSKSSEIASKISQLLDQMVTAKEKKAMF